MDRRKLSRLDEELESSEVQALCFLCRDVISKKHLEGVRDAKDLFLRLEERGLLENAMYLSQLLDTISRADLLSYLETDSRQPEETDAVPMLSMYRVMLYKIYDNMTQENFEKMKFLLGDKLGRRSIETCNTALELFAEMEKANKLSEINLTELQKVLQELDQQLASAVQRHIDGRGQQEHSRTPAYRFIPSSTPSLPVYETLPSDVDIVYSDAEPPTKSISLSDQTEYYALTHTPRGWCVVFNNEKFLGPNLKDRRGTQQDEDSLHQIFTRLGFEVVLHKNLTANAIRRTIKDLGRSSFLNHDALVVCVLSHGEKGCVYGTDEQEVYLRELTGPFTSERAPTLVGKPKLFFIQACQGSGYQRGSIPFPSWPKQQQKEEDYRPVRFEADAGHISVETVPSDADFLLGMATLPEFKSFRNTNTGSIYIQQLCKQLMISAESSEMDDILTVLTRVNREVGKGDYLNFKQMPEPKYTLTKKLVLKYVK